jgi:hypothetical protein
LTEILKNQKASKENHKNALDIFVSYGQLVPNSFKNTEDMSFLIDAIFTYMLNISEYITEEWKCPPEGYSDDASNDEDLKTTKLGMNLIDRIIASVDINYTLPLISTKIVGHSLNSADWRHKYSGIMVLSQIAEHVDDESIISGIIAQMVRFLKD